MTNFCKVAAESESASKTQIGTLLYSSMHMKYRKDKPVVFADWNTNCIWINSYLLVNFISNNVDPEVHCMCRYIGDTLKRHYVFTDKRNITLHCAAVFLLPDPTALAKTRRPPNNEFHPWKNTDSSETKSLASLLTKFRSPWEIFSSPLTLMFISPSEATDTLK